MTSVQGIGYEAIRFSYLSDILPLDLRSLNFELVNQGGIDQVRDKQGQAERPHKRDGVEKVGVTGTCVDPEVVECWSEESGIE